MSARACKVFLVGEGPSELGALAREPQYRTTGANSEGYLQPLLRKIAGPDRPLEFDGKKYSTILQKGLDEPDEVQGRRARAALALAAIVSGAQALVYLVDTDKEQGRKPSAIEARRLHKTLTDSIAKGFELAREADPELEHFIAIGGVPLRMLEAWALGDPAAITEARGDPAKVPATPEALWGSKHDLASDYPKHALARALTLETKADIDSVVFATIAENSDPDEIARRCPVSFAPFLQALRDALDNCPLPEADEAPPPTRPARAKKARGRRR